MPVELAMCAGEGCPLRARCYRHRAIPSGRQDWLDPPPYAEGRCGVFLDIDALVPTDEAIRERAYHLWLAEGRPEDRAEHHWAMARAALTPRLRDA